MPTSIASRIAGAPRRHDNDYPLWQGPCGAGPLGGITQSMLARFIACRERFRLKYVCGLEPPDRWNRSLGYGNMWHVCEEENAANRHHFDALSKHSTEMCNHYPLQRAEITKWHNVCCAQFPEYIKYWADHPDVKNRTPLLQEQVFDVPYRLPSGRTVRLRGKWDSVDIITDEVTGPSGGVYLQENKTKGNVDKAQIERQLRFDLQTMLYLVALNSYSKEYTQGTVFSDRDFNVAYGGLQAHRVLGVRFNVIRRPLSGGVGTIKPHGAKATKTKYTPAETDQQFYERLRRDYLAADPAYWFFRVRAEISQKDIHAFRDTCLDPLLETVCDWYEWTTDNDAFDWQEHPNKRISAAGLHYRTPFGLYNPLMEDGATEYDHYLETGSEANLRRVETLFGELQ